MYVSAPLSDVFSTPLPAVPTAVVQKILQTAAMEYMVPHIQAYRIISLEMRGPEVNSSLNIRTRAPVATSCDNLLRRRLAVEA